MSAGAGCLRRPRRLTAGWGGLAAVSKITGIARSTINRGEDDLDAEPLPKGRVRRRGGRRRALSQTDPGLAQHLHHLAAARANATLWMMKLMFPYSHGARARIDTAD
jgi:hypothetical protein